MADLVVPDIAMLREPNLLMPGKKPVGPVDVDSGRISLSDYGEYTAGVGKLQTDGYFTHYTGERIAPTSTNNVSFERNAAWLPGTTGSRIDFDGVNLLSSSIAATTSQLFFVIATARSYGQNGFGRVFGGQLQSSNDVGMFLRSSGSPYLRITYITTSYNFSFAPTIGETYTYGLYIQGAALTAFVGKSGIGIIEEKSIGAFNNYTSNLLLGNSYRSGSLDRAWDGSIDFCFNDYSEYSDSEINDLVRDPYQFLKPAGT